MNLLSFPILWMFFFEIGTMIFGVPEVDDHATFFRINGCMLLALILVSTTADGGGGIDMKTWVLLGELEPGADHAGHKGGSLIDAKKKHHIGPLKNNQQLVKALEKAKKEGGKRD